MIPRLLSSLSLAVISLVLAACSAPAPRQEDVIAVMESFYTAMDEAKPEAAMAHIAADAVFVESGKLETRAEYEKNHLPFDIEFETKVVGKRSPWQVKFQGDTAWAIATTDYEASNDNPRSFVSAQLAVLTREDGTWRIRSIHWSSLRR